MIARDFLAATTVGAAFLAACGNTYVVGGASGAGRVLVLDADLVLSANGDFELTGSAGARCLLRGNGHSLRTADAWSGKLTIRWCDIVDLGTADMAGIDLNMHGAASATIEDSTFDASGQVHVLNYDESTVTFSQNLVLSTSLVPAVARIADSRSAFSAQGGEGTGQKLFQGNRILHGDCEFSAAHWTIGGDGAGQGNLLVGPRAGLLVQGPSLVVRGNYVHTVFPTEPPALPNGQELSPFTSLGDAPDLLVEHNVIRHGFWVLRGITGELRYNALVDADASDWIIEPRPGTKIHHNVFVDYAVPGEETNNVPANPTVQGGIDIVNGVTTGVQIWANTFDGGGTTKYFGGSTIGIAAGSFVDSIRSNIFMRFAHRAGSACVAPGTGEPATALPPVRLGYADYNLFFNREAELPDNYAVAVANRVERQDSDFGADDVPRQGARDAQVDPELAGPFVERFPWTDEQILSREVDVRTMLAYFRRVYAPRVGSPVIDAGDPRDGIGADIGAIGAGERNPDDRFGDLAGESTAAARSSDGPLVLRCSARGLGATRSERLWQLVLCFGLVSLIFGRLRGRLELLPALAKARSAAVKPDPDGR